MGGRHRVRFPCIQIIKTATVPAAMCKRDNIKQFHNSKIKFPLVHKLARYAICLFIARCWTVQFVSVCKSLS